MNNLTLAKYLKKYYRSLGIPVPSDLFSIIGNNGRDITKNYIPEITIDSTQFKHGGNIRSNIYNQDSFNEFNEGGSHEINPLGGIPVGNNASVEQGETSINTNTGKFIFSDRIDTLGNIFQPLPDSKEFTLNYVNSPKYRERLQNRGYINNCGEPGQPPCPPESLSKEQIDGINLYADSQIKIGKEREKYFNPKKVDNISTGDWKQDFLYKNDWLMNVPGVDKLIIDKAKDLAKTSQGFVNMTEQDIEELKEKRGHLGDYTGTNWGGSKIKHKSNLVDQYFSKEALLPKSKYKPSSDYLEFLPSYSVKGNFEEMYNKSDLIKSDLKEAIDQMFVKYENEDDPEGKNIYEDFLKNKKPVYGDNDVPFYSISKILGVDLGRHKTGAGWDEEVNLPYISLSDAWDFEPEHYSINNAGYTKEENSNKDASKERSYIQSYLMHKAGNPFKIYDRFYFDPKTKEYIPDSEISKLKKKKR